MIKIAGIYKITNPVGKFYIGQSIDILKRFKYYKRLSCKLQPKLFNSFIKYGINNHVFEIIENCSLNDLNKLEIFYIKKYNSFNPNFGLNLNTGGFSNYTVSEESKYKNRLSHLGKIVSKNTRIKMGLASKSHKRNLGKIQTLEWIEKRKLKTTGLKRSEETKLKLSIIAKNRIISNETRKKISDKMKGVKRGKYNKSKL